MQTANDATNKETTSSSNLVPLYPVMAYQFTPPTSNNSSSNRVGMLNTKIANSFCTCQYEPRACTLFDSNSRENPAFRVSATTKGRNHLPNQSPLSPKTSSQYVYDFKLLLKSHRICQAKTFLLLSYFALYVLLFAFRCRWNSRSTIPLFCHN